MSAIPAYRDIPLPTPRSAASKAARARLWEGTIRRTTTFGAIAVVAYLVSSLSGNMMMESARREGIRAVERARESRKAEFALRQSIDAMTGLGSIHDWAIAHQFQAPEQLGQPSIKKAIVAVNR